MSRQEEKALEYQNANLNAAPYDAFLDGYQYVVEKYERLIKNQLEQDISLGYANSFIDDLRKAMEE